MGSLKVSAEQRLDAGGRIPAHWQDTTRAPISAVDAFNGYLAANVTLALDSLGIWRELEENGQIGTKWLRSPQDTRGNMVTQLLSVAVECGYLSPRGNSLELTETGRELARYRGYFTWLAGGYGSMLMNTSKLVTAECVYGDDIHRDEALIAEGTATNDRNFMTEELAQALSNVEYETIADLGSGTAERLCRIARSDTTAGGLAIDISKPATELAQRRIEREGLNDRVEAICADALVYLREGQELPRARDVDLVMSFYLLHDLLADQTQRHTLFPRMRDLFPSARTFVFADGFLRDPDSSTPGALQIFSLGYETVHSLMGVPLHSRGVYEDLFCEAGLRPRLSLPFGPPNSWLYILDVE